MTRIAWGDRPLDAIFNNFDYMKTERHERQERDFLDKVYVENANAKPGEFPQAVAVTAALAAGWKFDRPSLSSEPGGTEAALLKRDNLYRRISFGDSKAASEPYLDQFFRNDAEPGTPSGWSFRGAKSAEGFDIPKLRTEVDAITRMTLNPEVKDFMEAVGWKFYAPPTERKEAVLEARKQVSADDPSADGNATEMVVSWDRLVDPSPGSPFDALLNRK